MTVVVRESKETHIRIVLTKGTGVATISTGEPFLDHMLTALTRYAGFDLEVKASGDLRHHLIEDVAIALGAALQAFAPATCARYGERTIPMDDALVHVALDLWRTTVLSRTTAGVVVRSLHAFAGRQCAGNPARARVAGQGSSSRGGSRVQGAGNGVA